MLPITPFEAPIDTAVSVPGSKSITNRALVVASLAEGKSRLSNVLHSDDTRYMMSHLRTLGISLQASDDEFEIEGLGGNFHSVQASLFCGNAGTTVRFLSAFCALVPGAQVITGDQRMRPLQLVGDGFAEIVQQGSSACGLRACTELVSDHRGEA